MKLFQNFVKKFKVQITKLPEDLLHLQHLRHLEVQSRKVCIKFMTSKIIYCVRVRECA